MSLTIAFPDGALGGSLAAFLEGAGPSSDAGAPAVGERLRMTDGSTAVFTVAADVGVSVERGACDAGLVGRELLLERCPDVSEMLRLPLRRARLVFDWNDEQAPRRAERRGRVRVATPFPHVAASWLAALGRQAEPIRVTADGGELAAMLADATLRLTPVTEPLPAGAAVVAECDVSLIAGHAARALRAADLATLTARLRVLSEAA